MDTEKIGKFLQELRKENNLTQREVAEKLNVSDKTISRWESGTSAFDNYNLTMLGHFYKVSYNELINGCKNIKKRNRKKKIIIISIISIFVIMILSMLIPLTIYYKKNYNTFTMYTLKSNNLDYELDGLIIDSKKLDYIVINNFKNLFDVDKNNINVYSYKISLLFDKTIIYSDGDLDSKLDESISLNNLIDSIGILYKGDNFFKDNNILVKKVKIVIDYKDKKDNLYTIDIPINIVEFYTNK